MKTSLWSIMRDYVAVALTALACVLGGPLTSRAQDTAPILIDGHMSVGAGAAVMATAGDFVARAEDAVVPHRLFAENGVPRRTANVLLRVFKIPFFDLPQEQTLIVVNHEVFGHGARLRERFDASISYHIDAPFPFGDGGGSTSFELDREPTTTEWLAIGAAGMEVDGVAAGLTAHRAFVNGRMRSRDAMRYVFFELDTLGYVLSTGDQPEEPGHDVSDFLQTYNTAARSVGASELTAKTLRREVVVALANPMLGYALYGIGNYVWSGDTDVPVPSLNFGGVRYLPYLRYRLTSFGTEWAVINELGGRIPPLQIEARFGRSLNASPFGLGVRRERVTTLHDWRIDAGMDLWRQPPVEGDSAESLAEPLRWGVQFRGRAERPLSRSLFGNPPLTFIVDLAFKTQGFVAGEPLGSGIVARAGIGIPLHR